MRINTFYNLHRSFRPVRGTYFKGSYTTQKQFDGVAIYHRPTLPNFKPIIFHDNFVKSGSLWEIKGFYQGLSRCVDIYFNDYKTRSYGYMVRKNFGGIKWGCRHFTLEDICTMMEIMEYYYTDKQLGR